MVKRQECAVHAKMPAGRALVFMEKSSQIGKFENNESNTMMSLTT